MFSAFEANTNYKQINKCEEERQLIKITSYIQRFPNHSYIKLEWGDNRFLIAKMVHTTQIAAWFTKSFSYIFLGKLSVAYRA